MPFSTCTIKTSLAASPSIGAHAVLYEKILNDSIQEILRKKLINNSLEGVFAKDLPFITTSHAKESSVLSIYLLSKKRGGSSKFFIDMLSKWLMPGKLLFSSLTTVIDFCFSEGIEGVYTLVSVQYPLIRDWDRDMMLKNLEILEQELKLGVTSTYHAHQILEMRGLSGSEKVGIIQEEITRLIQRFPQRFDYDIFAMMQHCFVASREEFKNIRECRHLIRLISSLYILRKKLFIRIERSPQKRQIVLLFKRATLHLPLGVRYVLGVFVGLNFVRENEVFAKKHLIRSIQTVLPHVKAIEDSYLEIEEGRDSVHLLYLEVEKEDKSTFTSQEIALLQMELPESLKGRVEYLLRPVFMPRNEEEVMRNIIILSKQLKYVKDLPQVVISFDEQTDKCLSFTVIVVRVYHEHMPAAAFLVKTMNSNYEVVIERERTVGAIRNRYSKEAVVIRMTIPSLPFLREDDSVDLYVARKEVLSEVQKAFGEVRDFNGGMISKQAEAFLSLKKLLGTLAFQHKLLLENFFHSLYPIESRSTLNPRVLKVLFEMLLEGSKGRGRKYNVSFNSEEGVQLVLINFHEIGVKQKVIDAVNALGIISRKLIQLHLQTVDGIHLGYIHLEYDEEKRKCFYHTLQRILDF